MNDKPLFPDGTEKTAEKLFNCPLSEEPPKRSKERPGDPVENLFNLVAKFFAVYFLVLFVWGLLLLGVIGGLIWVTCHFISKLW